MNRMDKMERRFGHIAIPNLIWYILAISVLGNVLNLISPSIYGSLFSFDVYQILHGQIWRLVTFLMIPSVSRGSSFFIDLVWYVIWLSLYYYVGTSLERMWGKFRFNLYYFSGLFIIWIIGFAGYFIYLPQFGAEVGQQFGALLGYAITNEYLNLSLFLMFAATFPDVQFLLYFILPVKAKWLGIFDLVYLGYLTVKGLLGGSYIIAALIIGALINCGFYTLFARGGLSGPKEVYRRNKRRKAYREKAAGPGNGMGTIHRCAVCGRTEKDAPELEFRYCSKCEGNYEYCSDHLFTHEHVHK